MKCLRQMMTIGQAIAVAVSVL